MGTLCRIFAGKLHAIRHHTIIHQSVKPANYSDKAHIIDILARSFASNRSVNYIVKQDAKRRDRIKALMAYCFDVCYRSGEAWLSEDNKACALILYPDRRRSGVRSIILDLRLIFRCVGIRNLKKTLARERLLKHIQPRERRIAYLWFIAVDTPSQGKGIGSAFLQAIMRHCAQENRPIYLETSTPKNLPWYEKNGFDVYHEEDLNYRLYFLRCSVGQ